VLDAPPQRCVCYVGFKSRWFLASGFTLNWMEMGGVFAMACMREGGEYGENGRCGTKRQEAECLRYFIAGQSGLIATIYPIQEAASGVVPMAGLRVGSVMTQRPNSLALSARLGA